MRLKTNIVIDAALRQANKLAIPACISKKGDPDAGAIFLELETGLDCVTFFIEGSILMKMKYGSVLIKETRNEQIL